MSSRSDINEKWLKYGEITEHDACGIGAVADILGRKSRGVVDDALKIVEKLEHRAGKDALGETGDGVGILVQICHPFFKKAAAECGIETGEAGDYAVGMFFFPQETARSLRRIFSIIAATAMTSTPASTRGRRSTRTGPCSRRWTRPVRSRRTG